MKLLNRIYQKLRIEFHSKHKKRSSRQNGLYRMRSYYDLNMAPPDVLYFGDSVVERVALKDLDRRNLGEMVCERLKMKYSAVYISYSAYNSMNYFFLIKALAKMKNKPKMIIIPINLRSFSPQWDLNPLFQFKNEINLIKAFLGDKQIEIPYHIEEQVDDHLFREYDQIKVEYPNSPFFKVGDFRRLIGENPDDKDRQFFRTQQIFIFNYLYNINFKHRKLKYIEDILNLLQEMEIVPVLYITPINYEAGRKFVGDIFQAILLRNVNIVLNCLKRYNAYYPSSLIDFHNLFKSEMFFHPDFANEHLNDRGRIILSSKIVNHVFGCTEKARFVK